MNKLTIATASLAAAGAVSVLPATADAALTKGRISGRLTLPQFEAEMAERDSRCRRRFTRYLRDQRRLRTKRKSAVRNHRSLAAKSKLRQDQRDTTTLP